MIIDISQEVFSSQVFPGDPAPVMDRVRTIGQNGKVCNMTAFSMCAHNGTHVDAPFHFIENGATLTDVGLEPFVGDCCVVRYDGALTADTAHEILSRARAAGAADRILIAGQIVVTPEAAQVFAGSEVKLLGIEGQCFGLGSGDHVHVHHILLGAGLVLLEGAVLKDVAERKYFLSAAPLHLGHCEGAPCRAYLMG